MKKLGKRHRSFFRICAIDQRTPRDGRVLEELGTYDPHVPDADARARIIAARAEYWLSVGAQPSEKVRVLLKKYGPGGTHLEKQQVALANMAQPRVVPDPGPPASRPKPASAAEGAQNSPAEPVADAAAPAAPLDETPES
jgi:small subunit ribosomal protein S16